MAMIGRNAAIAEVGPPRELHGSLAYASWLGVHAWLLSGFRERVEGSRPGVGTTSRTTRASAIIDRPEAAHIDWDDPGHRRA